jgi:predicted RNase H-like HicB family nuclease
MKEYKVEIVVEKEAEDEGYFAYATSLLGCFSNGKTVDDAKRNMRSAIEQHLESLLAYDQLIPHQEKRVYIEELTVNIP